MALGRLSRFLHGRDLSPALWSQRGGLSCWIAVTQVPGRNQNTSLALRSNCSCTVMLGNETFGAADRAPARRVTLCFVVSSCCESFGSEIGWKSPLAPPSNWCRKVAVQSRVPPNHKFLAYLAPVIPPLNEYQWGTWVACDLLPVTTETPGSHCLFSLARLSAFVGGERQVVMMMRKRERDVKM